MPTMFNRFGIPRGGGFLPVTRLTLPVISVDPASPIHAAAHAYALQQAGGLRAEVERAVGYALQEKAWATKRAYGADWRAFSRWCEARGATKLPALPEVVSAYLSAEADAGRKVSTIVRRAAAIRYAHSLAGLEPPTNAETVKATLRGIRRAVGVAPVQKMPATADKLLDMLQHIPADTLAGLRDRAILLLGFAGAFRRSELVALVVADLDPAPEGLRVMLRRSKTDQEGAGRIVPVLRGDRVCPVEAVEAWLAAAGIVEGPIFVRIHRNGKLYRRRDALPARLTAFSIAQVVKHYAGLAGFRSEGFSGHSLRAGFLTSASEHGADVLRMAEVSGHRSMETLRGYVRRANHFKGHAGKGLL